MKRTIVYQIAISLLATVTGETAFASIQAVDFAGGGIVQTNNNPWTLGYEFSVSQNYDLTDLGIYDDLGNGFVANHTVGLWKADGTLLATVSFTPASAGVLDNQFRYKSIAPISLDIGQHYVVGASNLANGDGYIYNPTGFTTAPGVTFHEARYASGSSLLFPTQTTVHTGYFGGNVRFSSSAIPEPSSIITLTGLVLCLGAAGWWRRRRRNA